MGDYTWVDANSNGIQDAGEVPLAGVIVQLMNAAGTAVATDAQGNPVSPVTTDANGAYFVGNLLPGTYTAQFTLPSGYIFTTPTVAGGTSANDSNPTPGTGTPQIGLTPAFTIAASVTGDTTASTAANARFANLTIDAGVTPVVGLGDYTWIDDNANGIQDPGESPLPGVIVTLLQANGSPATDAQGNPVASVITDATGHYFIGNLLPGSYKAQFQIPSGYAFTTPTAGTSANDSNPTPGADPLIGTTPVFTVAASATGDTTAGSFWKASYANLTIDAGVVPVPSGNGGGSSDGGSSSGGDSAAPSSPTTPTTPTSPTTPSKKPTKPKSPTGPGTKGRNANGVSGGPGSVNPVPGASGRTVVGVGDLVWFDTNRNGIQDPGEKPMYGARVVLLNADGTRARDAQGRIVRPQRTDANGRYFFSNLQPGRYRMQFTYPQGYTSTLPGQGDKSKGSNAVAQKRRNVARTPVFTVAGTRYDETSRATGYAKARFANTSIDAGVIPPWADVEPGQSPVTG
jgi:hypothetical protein